jgi:hypothetical protein
MRMCMKWLSMFSPISLELGDSVTSVCNSYNKSAVCKVTRIYERNSSKCVKYCRLEFEHCGVIRLINVTYKSCKKVCI